MTSRSRLHRHGKNPIVTTTLLLLITLTLALANSCFAESVDENVALLDRTAKAFSAVVKKATPAVVGIQVEKTVGGKGAATPFHGQDPFEFFFNDPFFQRFFGPGIRPRQPQAPRKRHEQGLGSGFIISSNGYILTNNHVVGGADVIKVRLSDGRHFKAKVVGTDPESDVAVVKIEAKGLPTVPLGDSDAIEVGEWVIAIGNPFGLTQTVTVGVVSAKGRSRIGINDYEDFIQTDAAINPGNSGGPLLNIHGEVIGMNTAIFSKSGGYMGIGFAIPINMAKAIKDQLVKNGKVVRGWLGVIIQDMDEDLASSFGLKKAEGVLVSEVADGSPADKGGLKQGDIILKMDGHKVENASELRNRVALTQPGTKVKFEILRDKKHRSVTVEIGEKPSGAGVSGAVAKNHLLKEMGLGVQDLTDELADQFGYQKGQGVLIAEVEPESAAARVGMRPGQLIEEVNRVRIHSVAEMLKALGISKKTGRVLLRIRDGEYSRYVAIRLR